MSSAVCSLSTRKMKNYLVTSPARSGHCSRVPRTTFVRGRAPVSRVACCTCCYCGRCCCGRCASLRRSVCRSFRFTRRCCRAGRENPSSESSPSSHAPPMVNGGGNVTRRFLCCLCHSVRLVTAASVASSVTSDCVRVADANVGACCIDAICRSSLHTRSKMLELSSSPGVNFGRFRMSCATKRTGLHPLPNLASMSPIARIISSHSVMYSRGDCPCIFQL